jgi:hypothetical protein
MTQDEIIEMAKRVVGNYEHASYWPFFTEELQHFAKLVAERERKFYMQLFLDTENQPTQFGTATQEYREREIKDEREACAQVAAEWVRAYPHPSEIIANKIKERGQQ